MKHLILFLLLGLIAQLSAQCPPDTYVTLRSQQDVIDYVNNYPGCTDLQALVVTDEDPNDPVVDLRPLLNTQLVNAGRIRIDNTTELRSLRGLENITSAVVENTYDMAIFNNTSLLNLDGLEGVSSTGDFVVWLNPRLESINGIQNISSVDNRFVIAHTTDLRSSRGIASLATVDNFIVFSNETLCSLNGLADMQANGIYVNSNPMLSQCKFSFCAHFLNGGEGEIRDNKSGCNSIPEITNDCNSFGSLVAIKGRIRDPLLLGPSATFPVTLSGGNGPFTLNTSSSGGYTFEEVPVGGDYTVSPSIPSGFVPTNIKGSDVRLLAAYLEGDANLTPYQLIAADVNGDGFINSTDLSLLSSIVNGESPFPSPAIRFVAADFEFDPENPLAPFPEVINVNDLSEESNADFFSVIIGDIDGYTDPEVVVKTYPTTFRPGDTVRVSLVGRNFSDVTELGIRWRLDNDGNIIILPPVAGTINGTPVTVSAVGQNEIDLSWVSPDMSPTGRDFALLYQYEFVATSDSRLTSVINVGAISPGFVTLFDDFTIEGGVPVVFQPSLSNCESIILSTPTEGNCNHSLSYSEMIIGESDVRAVRLTALGGNTFDPNEDVLAPGFDLPAFSPASRTIVKADGSNFGEVEDDFFAFGFHNIETEQQLVQVEYLNFDLSVRCTDTLTFDCFIPEDCLEVSADTLICSDAEPGYRLQLNFTVPDHPDTEAVGRIRVNITGPVDFVGGIIYDLPAPLTAGESFAIDTLLPTLFDFAGDSLKLFVTAHDGPEERLCCFADSLCLPFPQCTDCGMPFLTTIDIPLEDTPGQCCFDIFINSDAIGDDFLDSMYLDVIPLNMESGLATFTPAPSSIWNFDPASSSPIRFQFSSEVPTNTGVPEVLGTICVDRVNEDFEVSLFADLIDSETLDHCFTDISFNSFCPALTPCDSLSSYILPSPEDCCYDVYLNNNYDEDPGLLRSVTVNLLGGPVDTFSGRSLLATAPGWNIASEDEANRRYTLTPSGMEMPLGNDQQVFQFCVAESFTSDSTYVEIAWQTDTDTICADTVAAICQNCLSIEEPTSSCNDFSPTFTFTFTNYSNIPGNTIRIINAAGFPNVIGTPDTITLTEMVGPGETYSGTITVDLPDQLEGQEACFDIILEQVLPNQSPIRCCYLTHCVEVELCGSGNLVPEGGGVLITAFPNPANTSVSITSQQTGLAELKLLSFTGHSVINQEVNFSGVPVPVELGNHPPGVYTLLVRFADGTQGLRRIVIR